jgi:hypothetical protein
VRIVDGVLCHDVQNPVVLLRGGFEGALPHGHVEEEVLGLGTSATRWGALPTEITVPSFAAAGRGSELMPGLAGTSSPLA